MAQRDVFPVRLSYTERLTIDALARKRGCSAGDVIRGWIHQANDGMAVRDLFYGYDTTKEAA